MSYKTEVYQIINDEVELDRYIDTLLDLGPNYQYYVSLFARKKYGGTEGLKSDKGQLKRFVSSKHYLKEKLRKLEVPLGEYKVNGIPINEKSLVAYISVNPRDLEQASLEFAAKVTKCVARKLPIPNLKSGGLSTIQVTGKTKIYNVDLDFCQDKEISVIELQVFLGEILNKTAYELIRTRGGYHILVNLDKLSNKFRKTWYSNLLKASTEYFTVDMSNADGMTPIPGCIQSDFTPKLILKTL